MKETFEPGETPLGYAAKPYEVAEHRMRTAENLTKLQAGTDVLPSTSKPYEEAIARERTLRDAREFGLIEEK